VDRQSHWQSLYQTRSSSEVGWYQPHLRVSLELISQPGILPTANILDVGAGDSTLVDDLLAYGYSHISLLDISSTALERAKARLGYASDKITWIEADILQVRLPSNTYDLWHDRALFHFLTNDSDRCRYVELAHNALKPDGYLIIATFAPDGPVRCSGLDTLRFSPDSLCHEFGADFTLIHSLSEIHHTPSGSEQQFSYCLFKKNA
jgi:SAM-dependent methyltransferase